MNTTDRAMAVRAGQTWVSKVNGRAVRVLSATDFDADVQGLTPPHRRRRNVTRLTLARDYRCAGVEREPDRQDREWADAAHGIA